MRRQKGQALVEFAFVLPILLMIVFMILYGGMMFADYLTLSNTARSSARDAALLGSEKYAAIKTEYRANTKLIGNLYIWGTGEDSFKIEKKPGDGNLKNYVEVTIKTDLNKDFPAAGFVPLPETFTIKYSMHDETASATN
ncbi:MAG: pilus assembly protein [Selenomonadaceae bacterium]|nr:pilus assembly protein [Selenomonadaceae bacterium]